MINIQYMQIVFGFIFDASHFLSPISLSCGLEIDFHVVSCPFACISVVVYMCEQANKRKRERERACFVRSPIALKQLHKNDEPETIYHQLKFNQIHFE